MTDALGRVALTVYDVFGQIQQVTHPDGSVVSTEYTHHGKPWKVVDELGQVTTTEFDAAGRAVRSIAPAVGGVSATTSTGYDAAGNVVRVTDPLGHVTESQYDERNRVVAVYAPPVWDAVSGEFVRPVTQSTYDALGQVLTVTDPQGQVTTKLYDRAGRNWKVIAPMVGSQSPMTRTKFDPGGLALVVTNPLGQSVTNTYDVHGRLMQTTDAAGIVNTFAYDDAGNRTSVKDGLNQETTFVYDGLNRLVSQTFANGDTTTFAYDSVHKLSQTSARGITTHYTYDSRDRVVGSYAPGITRTHAYDAAGRLMNVTEAENAAANVSYTYDALGRVTSETSRGVTHSYSYDLAGNRVRADYGTGRSVQTGYDALNRPELISEGGRVTRYGYDVAGRAVMLVAGNGQTSQNSYDAQGRLVARTLFKTPAMGESEVLAEFNWTHDLLGNVKQQLETWPGDASRSAGVRSTTMTYDYDNRLSTETVVDPSTGTTTTAYAYDAANNRLQKCVTGGSDPGVWHYLYNAVNQLMGWEQRDVQDSVVIKSATLAYDEAGNRVSQTVEGNGGGSGINPPPAAGGTTSYQWDAQDRLSAVTLPNGETHAYAYDYRTRRIGTQKFAGAVRQSLTAIVFAGGLSVAEFDTTTDTLPDNPTVEYTRGPDMGGGVGGMLYSLRGGNARYSLSNGRGDIVGQSDQGATLTWTASYEAYGRRTVETGENQDKQRANTKDEDPTGLLNEGFRYRDLETGGWLSRDPAGFVDGPNVYAYVKQNPWTAFDPHGLQFFLFEAPVYVDPVLRGAVDIGGKLVEGGNRIVPEGMEHLARGSGEMVPRTGSVPEVLAPRNGSFFSPRNAGPACSPSRFSTGSHAPQPAPAAAAPKIDPTPAISPLPQTLPAPSASPTKTDKQTQEENKKTDRDLYAYGNASGPRPPRPSDVPMNEQGNVPAQSPPSPSGASTFADPKYAPISGKAWKIPQGTPMPSDVGVVADGADVGGPHAPTHHTIYPTKEMPKATFDDKFKSLPWERAPHADKK